MSKRLLVTYGYHLKEHFAERVGIEYAKLDVPDVVTARFRGVRGQRRYVRMREDLGAKYAVDLHDDSPLIDYYSTRMHELTSTEKYWLIGSMSYSHAEILRSFARKWNKRRRRN